LRWVQVRAPHAGVITELFGEEGDNVDVGAAFVSIDTSAAPPAGGLPALSYGLAFGPATTQ